MIARLATIGAILTVALPAAADETPPPLTIHTAIETALAKNPTVQDAKEKINQTEAQYGEAFSLLLPNVSITGQADYQKDALNLANPLFGGTPYNQYNVTAQFTQPIFQFGILSGLDLPHQDRRLRQLDLEIATRTITQNVITSFYNLLYSQENLETLLETKSVETDSLKTTEHRYHIGRSQLLDVLQARTQLALLEPQIAQAHENIEVASAQLANLIGDPGRQDLKVEGKLDSIPLERIRAELEAKSGAHLPEYARSEVSIQRLDEQKAQVLGVNYPSLSAFGNYGRSSYVKTDLLDSASTAWTLGLKLTIPIFSGLSSIYQHRDFASQNAQLEVEQVNLRNNLTLAQVQSMKALELASNNIHASASAFDLADKALKEATKQYRLATIDLLQYFTIQQNYFTARSTWLQSKYNYITSLASYFVATGLPLTHLVERLEEKL